MIIYHDVEGSEDTAFHTFKVKQEDMNIIISDGEYFQNGVKCFETTGETITIEELGTNYQIWLTAEGFKTITAANVEKFEEVENPIDRIAWFFVPVNVTNFDDVKIHVMRTVK